MNSLLEASSVATVVILLAGCGDGRREGAPSAASASVTQSVYYDALGSGWSDWSWANRNLAATSPVASGTRSISVTYGPWQGLYFHHAGLSTAGLADVELRVNGGATTAPVLVAKAVVGGVEQPRIDLGSHCDGGAVPANAWTRCRIPLAALRAANATLNGIILQEFAGRSLPALYVDELKVTAATATAVAVAVSPATAALYPGQSQQFTASVTGTTNTAVTWSVQEGSAGGRVSATGLYTAPSAAGTFHVIATSSADPTARKTSTVTVSAPPPAQSVSVAVSPASGAVDACRTLRFTATVTGTADTSVGWTVLEGPGGGTIDASGVYTAPATAGTYHVLATSRADPTRSSTAAATVSERVLSVAVSPQEVTVPQNGTAQLSATVTTTCGSFTQTKTIAGPAVP